MVVEQAERVLVATAGQLDQRDQPGAVGLVLLGGGGVRRVVEPAARGARRAGGDGGLAEQEVAGRAGDGEGGSLEEDGRDGCAQGVESPLHTPDVTLRVDDDPPGTRSQPSW